METIGDANEPNLKAQFSSAQVHENVKDESLAEFQGNRPKSTKVTEDNFIFIFGFC